MANLLTNEYSTRRQRGYRLRLINLYIWAAFILVLMAIVLVLISWVLLGARKGSASEILNTGRGSAISEEVQTFRDVVRGVNARVSRLGGVEDIKSVRLVIDSLLRERGDGVSMTTLTFDSSGVIVVRGQANTRNDLVSFIDGLKANEHFSEVESPISNLIANTDIEYVVSVVMDKKDKE